MLDDLRKMRAEFTMPFVQYAAALAQQLARTGKLHVVLVEASCTRLLDLGSEANPDPQRQMVESWLDSGSGSGASVEARKFLRRARGAVGEYGDGVQRAVLLVKMTDEAMEEEWGELTRQRWTKHALGQQPGGSEDFRIKDRPELEAERLVVVEHFLVRELTSLFQDDFANPDVPKRPLLRRNVAEDGELVACDNRDPIAQIFPLKNRPWTAKIIEKFASAKPRRSRLSETIDTIRKHALRQDDQLRQQSCSTRNLMPELMRTQSHVTRWEEVTWAMTRAASIETAIVSCELLLWFGGEQVGGEIVQHAAGIQLRKNCFLRGRAASEHMRRWRLAWLPVLVM